MSDVTETRNEGSGRLPDEVRKLVEALAGRAEEYLAGLDRSGDGSNGEGFRDLGGARCACGRVAPSCAWCPACGIVGLLRGERPELAAWLADQLTTFAAMVRSCGDEPASPGGDAPGESPGSGMRERGGEFSRTGSPESPGGPEGAADPGTRDSEPDDQETSERVQRIKIERVGGRVLPRQAPTR